MSSERICVTRKELDKVLQNHSTWIERSKVGMVELTVRDASADIEDLVDILEPACLSFTDLENASLVNVDLTSADLESINLSGANLGLVNFSDADLNQAILHKSDLVGAQLTGAEMNGADLSEANLENVIFNGAVLDNADFTGADIDNCSFVDLNLGIVKGLESVNHWGPSNIDLGTIRKSKGLIPEIFLKGCGFLDWEAELSRLYQDDISSSQINDIVYRIHDLRANDPITFFSVFISYSHSDKPFAVALHKALQAKGIRCWLDEHQMLIGDDIYEQIDRGIKHWDKLLLCCSQSSLSEKWWVDLEINKAFEKERSLMRSRREKVLAMIPLDLDGYLFSHECKNPKKDEITSRVAADFKGWENNQGQFDESVDKVIKALRADKGRRETPPASLI